MKGFYIQKTIYKTYKEGGDFTLHQDYTMDCMLYLTGKKADGSYLECFSNTGHGPASYEYIVEDCKKLTLTEARELDPYLVQTCVNIGYKVTK